jgi:hypothetical protein
MPLHIIKLIGGWRGAFIITNDVIFYTILVAGIGFGCVVFLVFALSNTAHAYRELLLLPSTISSLTWLLLSHLQDVCRRQSSEQPMHVCHV